MAFDLLTRLKIAEDTPIFVGREVGRQRLAKTYPGCFRCPDSTMVNKRRQQDLESDQEAEGSGSDAHSTSPSPSHPKRARHEAEDPDEERQRMKRADAEAEARWEEKMRVELHNQAKKKGVSHS